MIDPGVLEELTALWQRIVTLDDVCAERSWNYATSTRAFPDSTPDPVPPWSMTTTVGLLIHLVFFLLIGLAAGWLAGQITKGSSFGLVNDLIIGVAGSFVGGILFWLLGLSASGLIGNLIVATVGAIAFLFLVRQINRRM